MPLLMTMRAVHYNRFSISSSKFVQTYTRACRHTYALSEACIPEYAGACSALHYCCFVSLNLDLKPKLEMPQQPRCVSLIQLCAISIDPACCILQPQAVALEQQQGACKGHAECISASAGSIDL